MYTLIKIYKNSHEPHAETLGRITEYLQLVAFIDVQSIKVP